MKKVNKKSMMELSSKAIIVLIISLVVIGLLLSFMNLTFKKTVTRFEELAINEFATPPVAIINSPQDGSVIEAKSDLILDASHSYDLNSQIREYYWDYTGNGIIDNTGEVVNVARAYEDPGKYTITLKVMNKEGAVGTATSTITVVSKNVKDKDKYVDSPLFLTSDEINNYDNILRLIPLVIWQDMKGKHEYDYVIYNEFAGNDEIINIMDDKSSTKSIVFGEYFPGDSNHQISQDMMDNYFSYWLDIESFVLVHLSADDDVKLMSATYAAYINAPLIFIDDTNFNQYSLRLNGKKVIVIDDVIDQLNNPNKYFLGDNCEIRSYSLEDIYNLKITGFTGINSRGLIVS